MSNLSHVVEIRKAMNYRHTAEFRAAISAGMKKAHARGQYKNVKRARIRIKWNCELCGRERETTPSDKLRFCSHRCSEIASVGGKFETRKMQEHKEIRDKYRLEGCALYNQGLGCKAIGRILRTTHKIIRAVLIEEGVYQPGKLKHLAGASIVGGKRVWIAAEIKKSARKYPTRRIREVIKAGNTRAHRCIEGKIFKKQPQLRTKVRYRQREQERFKERYHNDPEFRIYQLCRRRLKNLLHGVKKYGRCMELVGCTTAHLREHIQSQFKPWMTWFNIGIGKGKWNIDHIIPCAAFDLTREDQQRICFHWTNLRPLGSVDNMRKGARIERDRTPCLL